MKIRSFFLFLLLLCPSLSYTQKVESLHSIRLGYPDITYSYEHALRKQFSINMEAGVTWGWQYSNHNTTLTFSPIFLLEPRCYYNVNKRFNDKRFINNSASFFCVTTSFHSAIFHEYRRSYLSVIPKWGFRRAMGNHFLFETQIGGGIQFNHGSSEFIPGLDIKFGYVF